MKIQIFDYKNNKYETVLVGQSFIRLIIEDDEENETVLEVSASSRKGEAIELSCTNNSLRILPIASNVISISQNR